MKRIALKALTILIAVGCTACIQSRESFFFKSFSLQKLVEENKSYARLSCDRGGSGGGGGGGTTAGTWAWGFGGFGSKEFHSHKGDGFFCGLKSDGVDRFDEAALIAGLRQDVEEAITTGGAKITDSGNRDSRSFYFAYTLDNIKGRVEVSGKRIQDDQYSLNADLDESGR